VERRGVNWKKWAAALVVLAIGGAMLVSTGRATGAHGRFWRTLSAFIEAFGGLLGIVLIGLCVLGFLLVADALLPKEDGPEADRLRRSGQPQPAEGDRREP
jgi:hypothetical protein